MQPARKRLRGILGKGQVGPYNWIFLRTQPTDLLISSVGSGARPSFPNTISTGIAEYRWPCEVESPPECE